MRSAEFRILVFLGTLSMLLAGCGGGEESPEQPSRDLIMEAWDAFEDGDWVRAAGQFRAAIDEDPGGGEGYVGLGWVHVSRADTELALTLFKTGVETDLRQYAGAHVGLALCLMLGDEEKLEEAAAAAGKALTRTWDQTYRRHRPSRLQREHVWLIRAQCNFELGEYEEAYGDVTELSDVTLDPESEFFLEDLLRELERLGTKWRIDW